MAKRNHKPHLQPYCQTKTVFELVTMNQLVEQQTQQEQIVYFLNP